MAKKLTFTTDELKGYFRENVVGPYQEQARKQACRLAVHANGEYPGDIIKERRPHEDPTVQEYREKVWKAVTKPTFTKVLNSLSKIRRSSDWQVGYPAGDFARIRAGERLEDYCEKNFPFFTSVTNWAFQVLLQYYIIDPNAVLVVRPLETPEGEADYYRPYGTIYTSAQVIDYREENYCVIRDPLGSTYRSGGKEYEGERFVIITTERIQHWEQRDSTATRHLTYDQPHGLGFMPAYQLKAVVKENKEDAFLYESRIYSMAEELDEAAREYSDLQAARVMNIYPERWEISTKDCASCNGTGKLPPIAAGGVTPPCEVCKGSGYISGEGPYGKMLVSRSILDGAGNLPIPPAGYVQKPVDVVRVQDEGVEKHLYKALAAVNMEYLAAVPLAQSGIAKEVDRDETTNFVHSIAEDIVRIMDWLYLTIATWRYGVQYSREDIKLMVPKIPVPEHFDLFSTRYAEEDIKNGKESKLNPVIISAMELSYAAKKFNAEPEVRDRLKLIFSLNPYPSVSEEEKSLMLANKAMRQVDYIISANASHFVNRAIIADERFPLLSYDRQRAVLEQYAKEIIDENSAARRVQMGVLTDEDDGTEDDAEDAENVEDNGGNVERNGLNGEKVA